MAEPWTNQTQRRVIRRRPSRVCVVGSSMRFQSGISNYTCRLAQALDGEHQTSVILMRRLLPERLYPGRARVGAAISRLRYPAHMPVFDGVDWYWGLTIVKAVRFLMRQRPDALILQWWSGTVLHTYLLLAALTRIRGGRVIIEFHEVLDTGEANIPVARTYVRLVARLVTGLAQGFVLHSEFDRADLQRSYRIGTRPVAVIPHGPYDHYDDSGAVGGTSSSPDDPCRLLFFGTIRPFKGLEDLLEAFNAMPPHEAAGYSLTVVGETWEGWTRPSQLIAESQYASRISFINRYVHDEEVSLHYSRADVVVLPYRRSSASGPLHIAMSRGLPVVVTRVGGLVEAAGKYAGAVFVDPADPGALIRGIRRATEMRGRKFADVHTWEATSDGFDRLLRSVDVAG